MKRFVDLTEEERKKTEASAKIVAVEISDSFAAQARERVAAARVIIDDVTLAQKAPDKPLALSLELSAYFRTGLNGN